MAYDPEGDHLKRLAKERKKKGYDPKCEELARHFLYDVAKNYTEAEKLVPILAQEIQDTVEGFEPLSHIAACPDFEEENHTLRRDFERQCYDNSEKEIKMPYVRDKSLVVAEHRSVCDGLDDISHPIGPVEVDWNKDTIWINIGQRCVVRICRVEILYIKGKRQ